MRMQTRSGASRASVLSRTTSAGGASPARAEPRRAGSVGEDRQRRYYIFLGDDTFCVRPLSVAEHVLFHVVHRQFPQAMTLCQRHKRYEGGARVHAQEGGAGNDGRRLRSAAQTNMTVSPLHDGALRPWSRPFPLRPDLDRMRTLVEVAHEYACHLWQLGRFMEVRAHARSHAHRVTVTAG